MCSGMEFPEGNNKNKAYFFWEHGNSIDSIALQAYERLRIDLPRTLDRGGTPRRLRED
jgi:hypothetical protein